MLKHFKTENNNILRFTIANITEIKPHYQLVASQSFDCRLTAAPMTNSPTDGSCAIAM